MYLFYYLCLVFVCHTVLSIPGSLAVTCGERAGLLALLFVIIHFPIWCPGSGVVFDCINARSLPTFLQRG